MKTKGILILITLPASIMAEDSPDAVDDLLLGQLLPREPVRCKLTYRHIYNINSSKDKSLDVACLSK